MKVFALFALVLTTSSYASTIRTSDDATLRSRFKAAHPNLTPGTYGQSIDHFGALPGQTFSQRYWTDSEYATAGADAPVIFHICGEGDAEQGYFLHDNAIEWAKALGAHLVYLEHRYYGQSLPFNDLSPEHLRYLTLRNVMEDYAAFQKFISSKLGLKGKWISVGGSYSGTLSAILRQTHPELFVGALAASAPMISGTGQDDDGGMGDGDLTNTDPSSDTGDRQWVYQACIEFGFWLTDQFTIFQPSASFCQQLFGNAPHFDATSYNQKYSAPFIAASASAPSNILFTYGSDDIWSSIGLSTQSNSNPKITILSIEGAGHHFDLNAPAATDSQAVQDARAKFLSLARNWLQ